MGKENTKPKKTEASAAKAEAGNGHSNGADMRHLDHRKLFKEGQRFLTPPAADSTRAFYESLLKENPDSKIAVKFCVEYGVLPIDSHKKLLKKYNHLKEKGAFSVGAQIKRALEKKEKKKDGDKDKKEKKEKKEKD